MDNKDTNVPNKTGYISLEAAISEILSEPTDAHYPSWYAEKLKQVPVANVRPVVPCKDCEFLKVGKVSMICAKGILSFIYPSDYCSRGKRRPNNA